MKYVSANGVQFEGLCLPPLGDSDEMGIYAIFNKINNKIYIGQTINIHKRITQHIYSLEKGSHYNAHLQRAFDKYKISSFVFMCLENVKDKNILDKRETYYIQKFKAFEYCYGYNKTEEAGIAWIAANRPRDFTTSEIAIVQLDFEGNFIKEWESGKKVAIELGFNAGHISKCCKRKRASHKGFIWVYKDDYYKSNFSIDSITDPKKTDNRFKIPIVQLDLEGNFIKEWDSARSACRELDVHAATISKCCKGIRVKHKDFKWMYKEDYVKLQSAKLVECKL